MKSYFKFVALLLFLIVLLGIILPYLISANSSELFVMGLLLLILSPAAIFKFWKL